jgi:hypothetical protein
MPAEALAIKKVAGQQKLMEKTGYAMAKLGELPLKIRTSGGSRRRTTAGSRGSIACSGVGLQQRTEPFNDPLWPRAA